jgi:hypothetical protein
LKQSSGYTIRQTAKILDSSTQNIFKLIKHDRLTAVEDNGQTYISVSSLVTYVQRRLDETKKQQKKFENALKKLLIPIDN